MLLQCICMCLDMVDSAQIHVPVLMNIWHVYSSSWCSVKPVWWQILSQSQYMYSKFTCAFVFLSTPAQCQILKCRSFCQEYVDSNLNDRSSKAHNSGYIYSKTVFEITILWDSDTTLVTMRLTPLLQDWGTTGVTLRHHCCDTEHPCHKDLC